jgi:Programmed cell death protein 2, C-terminal putative domain
VNPGIRVSRCGKVCQFHASDLENPCLSRFFGKGTSTVNYTLMPPSPPCAPENNAKNCPGQHTFELVIPVRWTVVYRFAIEADLVLRIGGINCPHISLMSKRLSTTSVENPDGSEPWVLGFASSAIHRQGEAGTDGAWRETRLGGQPIWPPGHPGIATPHCALCGRRVVLVLQAFAPTCSYSERILYVFACNSMRCADDSRSWSCIRMFSRETPETWELKARGASPSVSEPADYAAPAKRDAQSTACSATGELGDDDSSDDDLDQFELLLGLHALEVSKRAEGQLLKPKLGRKDVLPDNKPKREASDTCESLIESATTGSEVAEASRDGLATHWLRTVSIEVDFEPVSWSRRGTGLDRDVERLLEKYRASATDSDDDLHWGEEPDEIESERTTAEDQFRERIERAPGQLLRYKYNGNPLWPFFPCPPGPALCNCGGTRVFEVQLLASCIHYLQPDDAVPEESSEAGMNWAAAAAYTCEFDCVLENITPVASWVAVWEPVLVQPDSF